MQVLRDNQQRHHWLRQESFLAHQSASIERLEMAINSQKRTLQFQAKRSQNFQRKNNHRGYKKFSGNKNTNRWRSNQTSQKKWSKEPVDQTNDTNEGKLKNKKGVTSDQIVGNPKNLKNFFLKNMVTGLQMNATKIYCVRL